MKLKRFSLSLVITLFSFLATAQTSSDLYSFILPSPNVMTFQKYVDYPVDYSTGSSKHRRAFVHHQTERLQLSGYGQLSYQRTYNIVQFFSAGALWEYMGVEIYLI